MEYVDGETLEQHLESGPLELPKGLRWAAAMADALAAAHAAGIVHRAVKPSNIVITQTGQFKILDFGLAKLTQISDGSSAGERLTLDDRIVGTPPYLSPEQALCEKIDARSDIFSLGTVLYEMFTGIRPFERASNVEMFSAIVKDDPEEASLRATAVTRKAGEDRRAVSGEKGRTPVSADGGGERCARRTPSGRQPRGTAGWARLRATVSEAQDPVAYGGVGRPRHRSGRTCLVESKGE